MLLLDKNNVLIGRFVRPLTTERTVVQLEIIDPIFNWHPEALENEAQISSVVLERVEWEGATFARLVNDPPPDLFRHEGFEAWNG